MLGLAEHSAETAMATCPYCDQIFTQLTIEPMIGQVPVGQQWRCLVFKCPWCDKAIGADIDLTAVRQDIFDAINARR